MQANTSSPGLDPVLPDVEMHLVPPTDPVVGRVVENIPCTKGKSASFVRHIAIDVGGTPLEGGFKAGQAFGVVPPGKDEKGRPQKVRLYSISAPSNGEDGSGRVLSTTCKRVLEEVDVKGADQDRELKHQLFAGNCSNYLCNLQEGDEVLVTGPAGKRFLLPEDPERHDYLFLATGTGIAPFRGMIKDLLGSTEPSKSDIHLVMGVPYTTDLLYDEYFIELAANLPNFHYHTVISREIRPDGEPGGYIHHYLDRQIQLHEGLLANDRTLVYMCGLAGMQLGVFKMMAQRGLGNAYLKVKPDYSEVAPEDWDSSSIRRYVRPTHRCMLEVY